MMSRRKEVALMNKYRNSTGREERRKRRRYLWMRSQLGMGERH